MLRSHRFVPVLLLALIAACEPADDQTATPGDTTAIGAAGEFTDADRAAIERASERFVTAALGAQWDTVASLYSDNAVFMPPNEAAGEGRAAIRQHLGTFPPLQSFRFDRDHIDGSGDLAYVQGRYTMTFTTPDGQTMEDRGKYIEIWERQSDGQWRITRDIFNSDLPAQPAS
jgi:ketosteroid isomerase-like protein